jgi:hypothetical protein
MAAYSFAEEGFAGGQRGIFAVHFGCLDAVFKFWFSSIVLYSFAVDGKKGFQLKR